jgi:IS5 family transposase
LSFIHPNLEDLSDRELERYLSENVAAKWFCGFGLSDATPDHTVFTRARARIGAQTMAAIFSDMRNQLKAKGYVSEVFTFIGPLSKPSKSVFGDVDPVLECSRTSKYAQLLCSVSPSQNSAFEGFERGPFIDATHLISKGQLWAERDELIKKKYEKMNNENISKIASDKEAKIGCKGGNKFWFGDKEHASVDMQSGLINKIAVTKANVTDAQGMKHVCPKQWAIYADKGYCVKPAKVAAAKRVGHLAAIKKNNMKGKNRDLDRWISVIRAPYERVFSKICKRVRYRGLVKNVFSAFMQALVFNTKRMSVLAL